MVRQPGDPAEWVASTGQAARALRRLPGRRTVRSSSACSGRTVPAAIVAMAMHRSVRCRSRLAEVVEGLAARGIAIEHSTVYRWVRRSLSCFAAAARTHHRSVGTRWRMDKTYLRQRGRRAFAWRAIDEDGQVVDRYVSAWHTAGAARAFRERASNETAVRPERATTDRTPVRTPPRLPLMGAPLASPAPPGIA
jgi:transposase-like protein